MPFCIPVLLPVVITHLMMTLESKVCLLVFIHTDDTVTCVLTGTCMLPCTSEYHDIIHWNKVINYQQLEDSRSVHSFYYEADQLKLQDPDFKNRTALFSDQIPQGNVSLLLSDIRLKDEGSYTCYASSSTASKYQEKIIRLEVKGQSWAFKHDQRS